MGFNNKGADHVAAQLRGASFRGIRGVSIGKNADTPLERAADDYVDCLRKLHAHADYFAINVSSPNTQGLRELQAADALAGILEPLQREAPATRRAAWPASALAGEDLAGSLDYRIERALPRAPASRHRWRDRHQQQHDNAGAAAVVLRQARETRAAASAAHP